jgi:hypothetical protein
MIEYSERNYKPFLFKEKEKHFCYWVSYLALLAQKGGNQELSYGVHMLHN